MFGLQRNFGNQCCEWQQSPVAHIHYSHIRTLRTTDVALAAHLVVGAGHLGDDWLDALSKKNLSHRYGFGHTTLQIETLEKDHACAPEAE